MTYNKFIKKRSDTGNRDVEGWTRDIDGMQPFSIALNIGPIQKHSFETSRVICSPIHCNSRSMHAPSRVQIVLDAFLPFAVFRSGRGV